MRKFLPNYLISSALILTETFLLSVVVVLCFQSHKYWTLLNLNSLGWKGRIHRADSALGYVPIPRSSGAMFLSDGSKIPVFYNSLGFRSDLEHFSKPSVNNVETTNYFLGLGCSFMFGFGVPVESTFCYLVANELGMIPLNAGRCSYGLAEMVLLARKIIPELRPKFVLVQYSPWLVERSQKRYAPTFCGLLPHPYFIQETGAKLGIHEPDFETAIFRNDLGKFKVSEGSVTEFINFTLKFWLPLLIYDSLNSGMVGLKEFAGFIGQPCQNSANIVEIAYAEIASICKQSGSRMIIVFLGMDNTAYEIPASLAKLNVLGVNAQQYLVEQLPENSYREYAKNYYHWGNKPLKIIDKHPNSWAHQIIAHIIKKKIMAVVSNKDYNYKSVGVDIQP